MKYFLIIAKWISEKAAQSYVGFAAFLVVIAWALQVCRSPDIEKVIEAQKQLF